MNEVSQAVLDGALALLLDRAGGEVRFTQEEHLAIQARRGSYLVQGEIDRSKDPPEIVVRIVPAPATGSMPIS